jgi:hypothetical protein
MNLPLYLSLIFITSALITLFIFLKATHFSKKVIYCLFIWIVIQTYLGLNLFYINTSTFPPRFLFLILPPIIFIIILFNTKKGKSFINKLDIKKLTIIHSVRILVEFGLWGLFVFKKVPVNMTFEGNNFDIFSGITAPFIYYFGFERNVLNKKVLLGWNIICLILLINIVINSILSSPYLFQKFGIFPPNIAILYFPYLLLPSLIVPIILFSHLVLIRKLKKATN